MEHHNRSIYCRLESALVVWLAMIFQTASADELQANLDALVGEGRSAVITRFGQPQLDTPCRLLYLHQPAFEWARRGLPTPNDNAANGGISPTMEPPKIGADGCEIEVLLDKQNRVSSVSYTGPGCFEYIHSRP